jgi:hypothetical protein
MTWLSRTTRWDHISASAFTGYPVPPSTRSGASMTLEHGPTDAGLQPRCARSPASVLNGCACPLSSSTWRSEQRGTGPFEPESTSLAERQCDKANTGTYRPKSMLGRSRTSRLTLLRECSQARVNSRNRESMSMCQRRSRIPPGCMPVEKGSSLCRASCHANQSKLGALRPQLLQLAGLPCRPLFQWRPQQADLADRRIRADPSCGQRLICQPVTEAAIDIDCVKLTHSPPSSAEPSPRRS